MPVILQPADYDLWLDAAVTDSQGVLPLLNPCPAAQMQARPLSQRVNNVRNDDAALTQLSRAVLENRFGWLETGIVPAETEAPMADPGRGIAAAGQ